MTPNPTAVVSVALETFTREEFIADRWWYQPGEHVTILAPTNYGKTWWTNQLLTATATPDMPAIVLATKPRDTTMEQLSRQAGYRIVTSYPLPPGERMARQVAGNRPPGYIVWPRYTGDPAKDEPAHRATFRRAVLADYGANARRRRSRHAVRRVVLAVDEIYGVTHDLKLSRELSTLWTRGRSVKVGVWGGSQRPFDVPQYAYSQPQHLFLGYTPDRRDRIRFREIGGIDPALIDEVVPALAWRQWLYIHREQRAVCIVGAV